MGIFKEGHILGYRMQNLDDGMWKEEYETDSAVSGLGICVQNCVTEDRNNLRANIMSWLAQSHEKSMQEGMVLATV